MTKMIVVDPDEYFMTMAVFSAFVDKGMRACPEFPALAANARCERALVNGAANFVLLAARLERAIVAADVPRDRSRGSVEQDVCEPFGAWYVQHAAMSGGRPVARVCRNRLADALVEYFAQGLAPFHVWTIICAVKAEEPTLRLTNTAALGMINWEWAPPFAITAEMRSHDEHPLYPRSVWKPQTGPVHIGEYWPWVEYQVRDVYVRSRYAALAASPDVFMDLVVAGQVHVDGCRLRDQHVRRDLAGLECIAAFPAGTVFSMGLFAALPGLHQAFREVDHGFDVDEWIGLPIANFLSKWIGMTDPDAMAIISGTVGNAGNERPFVCPSRTLWHALPDARGVWRLEDGTVLRLVAASIAGGVAETPAAIAAA